MKKIEETILNYIIRHENLDRVALSKKLPILRNAIVFYRCFSTGVKNTLNPNIKTRKRDVFFDHVVARHQSVLRRRLGDSDPILQERKITNLKQALKRLDGLIINSGDIFSFWSVIGKPTDKRGYVPGMLLSGGKVIEGVGGGLCQLSNFLCWILFHAPIEVVQRHHHSMDVFPDSGRVLPFGTGATVLYNFIDLKVRNISKSPLQLKIWISDTHLKGKILSPSIVAEKFHIIEKNHFFVKRGEKYFRYNEIYRETRIEGKTKKLEKVMTNFAPVLYEVTDDYLKKNNYNTLDFTE